MAKEDQIENAMWTVANLLEHADLYLWRLIAGSKTGEIDDLGGLAGCQNQAVETATGVNSENFYTKPAALPLVTRSRNPIPRIMTKAVNSEHLKRDIVVIGASAGGVQALVNLFNDLPNQAKTWHHHHGAKSPTHQSQLP